LSVAQEPAGERARRIWAEAATARTGNEKHVQAAIVGGIVVEPCLDVPHWLMVLVHDVRVDVLLCEPEPYRLT